MIFCQSLIVNDMRHARPVTTLPDPFDETYCGVYFIDPSGTTERACSNSNTDKPPNRKAMVNVKVGFSRKLRKRLDNYLLGSPLCIRMYGMIAMKRGQHAFKRMKLCEEYAHSMLSNNHLVIKEDRWHGHTLEWFQCSIEQIYTVYVRCMLYTSYFVSHRPLKSSYAYHFMFDPHVHIYKLESNSDESEQFAQTPKHNPTDTMRKIKNLDSLVLKIVNELFDPERPTIHAAKNLSRAFDEAE